MAKVQLLLVSPSNFAHICLISGRWNLPMASLLCRHTAQVSLGAISKPRHHLICSVKWPKHGKSTHLHVKQQTQNSPWAHELCTTLSLPFARWHLWGQSKAALGRRRQITATGKVHEYLYRYLYLPYALQDQVALFKSRTIIPFGPFLICFHQQNKMGLIATIVWSSSAFLHYGLIIWPTSNRSSWARCAKESP